MIDKNKKFFIIEKNHYEHTTDSYYVYDRTMYDLTTAVKKLLALDTLNEDKETTSYHLQEVNFSMVDKPLVLTKDMEVKEEQSELPF
jgi:predicted nucleic acid-binding protein